MAIDNRNFVDINIVHHSTASHSSTRDTVVLFTEFQDEEKTLIDTTYSSLNEIKNDTVVSTSEAIVNFATVFFNNGGIKLRIIFGVNDSDLYNKIKDLDNEFILVAYTGSFDVLKEVAVNRSEDDSIHGINNKILLGRISKEDDIEDTSIPLLAVKYSSVQGAEATIGAYLTQLNFDGEETVHDYSFTSETLTAEGVDNDLYLKLIEDNYNVDEKLANDVKNLGGNLKDGRDITNEFSLIVLHQILTDSLIELLGTKIKGQTGLAQIKTVLSEQLNKFRANGYLTTDEIWTDEDLTIVYNKKTYTIVEKNTPINLGYIIHIIPYSNIASSDKEIRKTPPIYVVLSTSYGIRQIAIDGEVL